MNNTRILIIAILVPGIVSCYNYKDISDQQEMMSFQQKKHGDVMRLEKKFGQDILFEKHFPGQLTSDGVVADKLIALERKTVDSLVFKDENSYARYACFKGTCYKIVKKDSLAFTCIDPKAFFIPYSEIRSVRLKIFSYPKTILLGIGVSVVVYVLYEIYIIETEGIDAGW